MFQKSMILSALVLSTSVACGSGPSETAPFRSHAGGAAGAGSSSAGGALNTGGATNTGGASAGGASGSAGSGGASNPNALRIENVHCAHEDAGLSSLVDDSPLMCRFDVLGDPSRQVTLRCENTQGKPVDCSVSSPTSQIQPFGPQPLPLTDAGFFDWPQGLAGKDYSIVMVADDGVEVAKHPLLIPVVADDGVNQAPTLDFDCAGDSDGQVNVKAGDTVSCHITYRDADPGLFDYSLERTLGAEPVNYVPTESGNTFYVRELDLVWHTDASEAGTSATYELTVNDTVAPMLKKSIVIDVQ